MLYTEGVGKRRHGSFTLGLALRGLPQWGENFLHALPFLLFPPQLPFPLLQIGPGTVPIGTGTSICKTVSITSYNHHWMCVTAWSCGLAHGSELKPKEMPQCGRSLFLSPWWTGHQVGRAIGKLFFSFVRSQGNALLCLAIIFMPLLVILLKFSSLALTTAQTEYHLGTIY